VANQLILTSSPDVLEKIKKLTIDTIKDFFERYISTYAPYTNTVVYDTLINNLTDYYFNQVYNNVPFELKELFESFTITSEETFNKLLVNIGVPQTVIESMNYDDKFVFLKAMANFEQYKGTVSFAQKLGLTYSETDQVNIYELYIDYDHNSPSDWVLKPIIIYRWESEGSSLPILTESIDYLEVYNSVPSLLIHPDELTSLRNSEQILLPIKSNILLVEYNLVRTIRLLYDLYVLVYLKTFKNVLLPIYFKDRTILSSLRNIYFAWYYLVMRYFDCGYSAVSKIVGQDIIKFAYDETIPDTDIPNLINLQEYQNTYDQLESKDDNGIIRFDTPLSNNPVERDNFYKNTLFTKLFKPHQASDEVTVSTMYGKLYAVDPILAEYLNEKILSYDNLEEQKIEIGKLLTDMKYTFITFNKNKTEEYVSDSVLSEGFKLASTQFMNYLPEISIDPRDTITYIILYNLKPYHVELLTKYSSSIAVNDIFESLWMKESPDPVITCPIMPKQSLVNLSDIDSSKLRYSSPDDVVELSTYSRITTGLLNDTFLEILDSFSCNIQTSNVHSIMNLSSDITSVVEVPETP
jgi:hypothetical protein